MLFLVGSSHCEQRVKVPENDDWMRSKEAVSHTDITTGICDLLWCCHRCTEMYSEPPRWVYCNVAVAEQFNHCPHNRWYVMTKLFFIILFSVSRNIGKMPFCLFGWIACKRKITANGIFPLSTLRGMVRPKENGRFPNVPRPTLGC